MRNADGWTDLADQGDHVVFAALQLGAQFDVVLVRGGVAQFQTGNVRQELQVSRLGRRTRQQFLSICLKYLKERWIEFRLKEQLKEKGARMNCQMTDFLKFFFGFSELERPIGKAQLQIFDLLRLGVDLVH